MKKRILVAFLVLLLAVVFCACSKASYDNSVGGADRAPESGMVEDSSSVKLESGVTVTERKIIQTVNLTVETKSFDSLMENLEAQVSAMSGYVESSESRVNSASGTRYANLTIRIPASETDSFTQFVSQNSTVTYKSVSTDDATLKYVDIESRISALRAEKTALEAMLEKAQTVSDIITVQQRLTDVIYQLESYESQLRSLENLVSYSTFMVYIREVERITVTEDRTAWQEIGDNLKNNTSDVLLFLKNAFIFVISAIPYIILISIIPAIVLIIIFAKIKKKKKQ